MLHKEEFIAIGHVRKSHGYKGHARVEIEEVYEDDFNKQDFIFLEIDGYKVPFYITERLDRQHLIIKMEHIDSQEHLLPHHQQSIYLLKKDVKTPDPSTLSDTPEYLVGMTLIDDNLGQIGTISKVEEYPQQLMAFVEYQGREVMVPLHEHLITNLDDDDGTLHMELPDGILDV